MSLRTLLALMDEAGGAAEERARGGTGLFFVLNAGFLRPFHVLVYSLIRNRSLLDLPVVVISEDERVAADPVVAAIADRFVRAGETEIGQFAGISGEKVEEGLRLGWIAKYTFLKWLVFGDYGFTRHVYLDADMVCLAPCDDLADLGGADVHAAPVFDMRMLRDGEGWMRPLAERDRRLREFLEKGRRRSLNSGVLVLNGGALGETFRRRLIGLAERRSASVEQAVVRRLLEDEAAGYSWAPLSPLDNFNHGFLGQMPVTTQVELLGRIRLLHFVGSGLKPWVLGGAAGGAEGWVGDALWRATAEEAAQAHPLFAEARDRLDEAGP